MLEIIKEKAYLGRLNFFMDSIKSFLEKAGVKEQTIFEIVLASEEILVNVMSYAYPDDQKGDVEVSCEVAENGDSRKAKLTFTDEGQSFDVLEKETPDLGIPIEDRKVGGLGIHLVKTLMDDVSYIRKNDQNILSIVKRI